MTLSRRPMVALIATLISAPLLSMVAAPAPALSPGRVHD